MPLRILRFCRQCLMTQQAFTRQHCSACGGELLPLLDEHGAMSGEFLAARGSCCSNGCRNCPYESSKAAGESCLGCSTEKTCPRCAATFACQSTGCWCND